MLTCWPSRPALPGMVNPGSSHALVIPSRSPASVGDRSCRADSQASHQGPHLG
jgi:hypothetical protein